MIVFDTDHINVLTYPESSQGLGLTARLHSARDEILATTVVSLEEQLRGWLALINRTQDVSKQVTYYGRLAFLVEFFSHWRMLPFDHAAAQEFKRLRANRVRIATMDLKIASIALVQKATLLSANLRDFRKVPGLQVDSWLS
jgi:tRNA(fMet)-specific endonuclease VapC